MGLGRNWLFTTVHTHKQHTVLTAKRKVRSFKAGKMKLNALVVVLEFTNHAAVDVVVEHVAHGMGSDGRGQLDGFAVELLANATQGFDTDDFTVCKLEPSNVYACLLYTSDAADES